MSELRIRRFDGTPHAISAGEKKQVRRSLAGGVDALLQWYPDFVDVYRNSRSVEVKYYHPSGRAYTITGIREDILGGSPVHKLSVSEDFGSHLHWYEPDADDVILRNDTHIGSMGRLINDAVVVTADGHVDHESTDALLDLDLAQEEPNRAMAQAEYFNLQPVGLDEITSIFDAVEEAELPTVRLSHLIVGLRDSISYYTDTGGDDALVTQAAEAAGMFEEDIERYIARGGKRVGGVSANPTLDEPGFTYKIGNRRDEASGREVPQVQIFMSRVDGDTLRGVTLGFTIVDGLFTGSRTLTEGRIPDVSGEQITLMSEPDVASAPLYVLHQRRLRNFLNNPTF